MAFRFCKVKRSATQVAGAMWGGTGRTFNRAADGAGDHQQWASQTRGNPSQELAARYAASAGLGAPAPTAATPPAAVPPGVAFAPSPHGQMEPPWVTQQRMQGGAAMQQAAYHAQQQQQAVAAAQQQYTQQQALAAAMPSQPAAGTVVAKRQNWWATLATSHPRISDCLVVLLRIRTAHQFSVESRLSRGLAHAPAPDEPP